MKQLVILLMLWVSNACGFDSSSAPLKPEPRLDAIDFRANEVGYEIIQRRPHNPKAFTQGLLLDKNGTLIESSGNYGVSYIARLAAGSGDVIEQKSTISKQLFAEGIAIHGNRLFMLTWRAGKALVFEPESLTLLEALRYEGEGWGLTANAEHLIMSNGSDQLQFLNPDTLAVEQRIKVRLNQRPVQRINELEWAEGLIYANIWYSDTVIGINPDSGNVLYTANLSALRHAQGKHADALNGIAFHPDSGNFWVTGKYWRYVYEIKLRTEAHAPVLK